MKNSLKMGALMMMVAVGASAHATTTPPTGNSRTNNQVQNSQNNFPYSNQATYSTMDAGTVPQNIRNSFGTEYNGVNDAKWESNNDVYRSSFMRDGREMSVIYGQDGKVRETRSQMNTTDFPASVQRSFNGKTASSPYQIKVGDNTYYSAQIDGQEMYYDSKGRSLSKPGKSGPKK